MLDNGACYRPASSWNDPARRVHVMRPRLAGDPMTRALWLLAGITIAAGVLLTRMSRTHGHDVVVASDLAAAVVALLTVHARNQLGRRAS